MKVGQRHEKKKECANVGHEKEAESHGLLINNTLLI